MKVSGDSFGTPMYASGGGTNKPKGSKVEKLPTRFRWTAEKVFLWKRCTDGVTAMHGERVYKKTRLLWDRNIDESVSTEEIISEENYFMRKLDGSIDENGESMV